METRKIRVCIADDHNVVRNAMVRLLGTFKRISEVKEAENGKDLLAMVRISPPDAVILDLEMPIMGGIETARHIVEHYPTIKILILTMHSEDLFVHRLLDLGVHGFLTKSAVPQEVEKALYSIIDYDFYKNEIIEKAVLNNRNAKELFNDFHKLTSREEEIMLLICKEYTSSEISSRLNISQKTFFNHRASILEKTNCRGNVGLLRFALQHGFYKLN